MKKVIDISYAQSSINWAKLAGADLDGVILRAGFRAYKSGRITEDAMFERHLKGVKSTGFKIGLYFFSEAITEEEAREEARFCLDAIRIHQIKMAYPIAIDTEEISGVDARANNLSKATRTKIVKAFCEEVKKGGYEPMIYASTYWLNSKIDMAKLPYKVWCAQYAKKCDYKGTKILWQYTDSGTVPGIDGKVDLSYYYGNKKEEERMAIKWDGKLTAHFSAEEYSVGNGGATVELTQRAYTFARLLEKFRRWLKRPMTVTSWARTAAVNKSVGGIATSNHLTGTACDWHTTVAISEARFIKYAKKWRSICDKNGYVGEAGLYPWGIHFGIQNAAQAKANGNKFYHWDSRSGKQKNLPFKELR